ncbi:glycosyltransferase [Pantoea sp. RRHST58]|uniref:glycosyltransferase n=1 Tax=Pantoea sp. RRHST58 TaxID=3425183 RepID=UPI003DA0D66E
MKNYGIYVCYQPTVVLKQEGLGRYLAAFIKGASDKDDVHFRIVCPSWSKEDLYELFESEGVSLNSVTIDAPEDQPIILKVHTFLAKLRKRKKVKKGGFVGSLLEKIRRSPFILLKRIETRVAGAYNFISLIPAALDILILLLMFILVIPFACVAGLLFYVLKKVRTSKVALYAALIKRKVGGFFDNPKEDGFVLNLYQSMMLAEAERMHEIIRNIKSVSAWYCPTAFWETFSDIDAPRLLCVPDVVLTRFPGGFSQIGGERFLNTFKTIQRTINKNEYFVTYSKDVKERTLIEHFNIEKDNVYVVNHAPNRLDTWLNVKGFNDAQASSKYYAERLLSVALFKNRNPYVKGLSVGFKYMFYASQFRPNKNVISLLKAYNYLLKNKFLQHKLVLTGAPEHLQAIPDFVKENNLERDVLFMNSLSVQELAACYKLADLAVNPTLSEGGCPFTFTEALSVGTPVVMGRIGVTEEVLTDPKLQEMTFFDPYDWKSIADKIEWALGNLDPLREVQLQTYHQLMKRTWEDVVSEHITAMDEIADKFHADRSNRIEQHR